MMAISELAFPGAEYDRRLAAVRMQADSEGLGTLLFFSPSSICYLCGFSTINLWDMTCLIVPGGGEPVLVFREFETGRFQVSCRYKECVTYPPGGTAVPAIVAALRSLGGEMAGIGVEMGRYLDVSSLEALRAGLPHTVLRDCSALLHGIRIVKSAEEIAVLRRAAKMTDDGVRAGAETIREGASDFEICAEVTRALLAAGSDFMCIQPVVAAGARSGIAHSAAGGAIVQRGDPVFLELGAAVHRYTVPIMRTVFAGEPADELRELSDYSSRALDAMIAAICPGAPAHVVAAAGRQALAPILPRISFHFVWGYSVGVGFPPSWLEETGFFIETGNWRELQPGMVFHLPLMLRVAGRFGAGFSETVLVTDRGAEVLSGLSRQG